MTAVNEYNLIEKLFPLTRKVERFYDRFCRFNGMPCSAQSRLLIYLALETRKRDVFQRDVEAAFQIRPSSATALLKVLETQGLIRRQAIDDDARKKKITLTPRTKAFQNNIQEMHDKIREQLLLGISAGELEQFEKFCARITANIEASEK